MGGRRRVVFTVAVLVAATVVPLGANGTAGAAPARPVVAAATPKNVEQYTGYYAERVLNRTYQTLFAKSPGAEGRRYWLWRIVLHPDAVWFVTATMGSSQYRNGLGKANNTAFVKAILSNTTGAAPVPDEVLWHATALRNGAISRGRLVAQLVEKRYQPAITRPSRPVSACRQYARGGLAPLCDTGSAGHQRNVDILQVPDTNIYVNRAFYPRFAPFVAAARSAGFTLSAARDPDVPAWMFSPGSWRSFDEQNWLYTHGYPANPPGRSMHEWGMAVDLDCNGQDITTQHACWRWVRDHGRASGVFLFHTVVKITDSEAWHVSSNGL